MHHMASSSSSIDISASRSLLQPHLFCSPHPHLSSSSLSFHRLFPDSLLLRRPPRLSQATTVHVQRSASTISPVCEAAVDGATNAAAVASNPPQELELKIEEDVPVSHPPTATDGVTIASVIVDVKNLIKLVDSRDIIELELKQRDYELVIKKKEALSPPPMDLQSFAPQMITHSQIPNYMPFSTPTPSASPSLVAPEDPPSPMSTTSPASVQPQILSPMAGTFYKCPGPGEPPFVKVGDNVTKGQVICIVEAMKLMNEIEADQSGTIVEILVEDGTPVAFDMPLFAIRP